MKRVLMITTAGENGGRLASMKDFAANLSQGSDEVSFAGCAVQELVFRAHDDQVSITYRGEELRDICEVLHLRNGHLFSDYANAIRVYADHYGIQLVNRADAVLPYYGKVSQGFWLMLNGVAMPPFVSSPSNETLLDVYQDDKFGYPIIIKHNNGIKGLDNYLVRDYDDAMQKLGQSKQGFLVQPFIANGGELRILTFGDNLPPLIFKKQAVKESHLNNTNQGGAGTLVDPEDVEPSVLKMAMDAARLSGREIGGVDVLLGDDGRYYVLEVNPTPSIVSGVFPSEKRERYRAFFIQTEQENQK